MLDQIGVAAGWHCIDLGCGPRGITDLLSPRVGSTGRVVGLDADEVFRDYARANAKARAIANLEFVLGNVYASPFPADSFDFVHTRFVASTAGEPDALLAEAVRLARPGGIVAFQEPENSTLNCYPAHSAWDRLKGALADIFPRVCHPGLAQDLYGLFRAAGLQDVHYRPFLVGFRSSHPMVDYVPATIESIRGRLLAKGLFTSAELDQVLAQCRAHLAQPGTVSTYHTVVQVWGRK
jgi:SAM-dependent methyltransferase